MLEADDLQTEYFVVVGNNRKLCTIYTTSIPASIHDKAKISGINRQDTLVHNRRIAGNEIVVGLSGIKTSDRTGLQ